MRKILFGLCLFLLTGALNAQNADNNRFLDTAKWMGIYYPVEKYLTDTLKIWLPGMEVNVATVSLGRMRMDKIQFDVLIKDFQQYYSKSINMYPEMQRSKIEYYPYSRFLTKTPLDTTATYYFNKTSLSVKQFGQVSECVIHAPGLNVILKYISDSALMNQDLQAKLNKCVEQLSEKEWNRTELAWVNHYVDSTLKPTYQKKSERNFDLHLYTGITITKNAPSLFAEVKAGYLWNNYGYDIGYYLSYDWNFTFGENGSRYINSFINLSAVEEGFLPKLKTMAGIDMGYLIFRQGDVFEKNTFRLGFGFKGDFFYFSPQIYFPGSFKGVYPGLRMCIGL